VFELVRIHVGEKYFSEKDIKELNEYKPTNFLFFFANNSPKAA